MELLNEHHATSRQDICLHIAEGILAIVGAFVSGSLIALINVCVSRKNGLCVDNDKRDKNDYRRIGHQDQTGIKTLADGEDTNEYKHFGQQDQTRIKPLVDETHAYETTEL
ncbi:hypothetical protein DPMN_148119 [Dreissena polymorpha]|uniref:Uncharacterized protein n=1 Tax=Dreissena polymorpha TaxID=45954 RepID=A0A9D4FEY3_DREPO|nr:hypothetical protein DPMN_148119 [Dreissena polymorpha]